MTDERISTGTDGLDDIIRGGLIPGRSYLIRGDPGTGKSILGSQYLEKGVENDETTLYVNLEETETDIKRNAATVGIDLEGVNFLDLSPDSDVFVEKQTYDIFEPNEVEKESVTEEITERVESLSPDRVFIDPVTRLRHITSDEFQFRQQVISFMRFLKENGATVVFTSQNTESTSDDDLQFLTDGTIQLERTQYGRSITIPKFRGSGVRGGKHTLRIRDDGASVYPELVPSSNVQEVPDETLPFGVPEVDEMLNGGLERGTVTIISGPTGVGKTTTGTQFLKEAAGRGERSTIYMFEETKRTLFERAEKINMPVKQMAEQGRLGIREIEPLDKSAQEFAQLVREDVEENDTKIVMIDGIDGYRLSLRGADPDLVRKLHTLGRYLKNAGVTVIFIEEVGAVTGEFEATKRNLSYLADNILILRHLEINGEMRKATGVLKKRTSDFERTLREFEISSHGLKVGEPLTELRGILSGQPRWIDDENTGREVSR
ncbi:ATPase domain-containing protein [Natrononativus amylolyticus]|uniref:ATPase domain-containing protein n=1 Tax=Natrononativus amylolyticus TaxID=2963434 RepID=UPI0020CBF4F1|nr:ATPase domain-containing protein [Natrononativus amylolyticus]